MKNGTILNNAAEKIRYFNKIGIHYEVVYHYVIRRYHETNELFNDDFLDDITAGLISFDMQRMMGGDKYISEGNNSWALKLKAVLKKCLVLKRLWKLNKENKLYLQDIDLSKFKNEIIKTFDQLSNGKLNRVSEKRRFPVGASKVLHFLIPDLFIIVDSNAKRELSKFHNFKATKIDGKAYYEAMIFYQTELKEWSKSDPDFSKLHEFDSDWKKFGGIIETPLPRIIDKCTFVGNKWKT